MQVNDKPNRRVEGERVQNKIVVPFFRAVVVVAVPLVSSLASLSVLP